ncbi:butyrophilin subfamily 3 member A2-like [Chaetodon trifascialis]|uniref:butyrophilin subfamily 3 member A2-like n=1 Tax=Chaetodon trifascialis TaxID=109706 RepID=UPI003993125F
MLRPMTACSDGLSISVLLFIFLMKTSEAQSQLICSDQIIVALAGDDVILPCHLEPPIDARAETVVWTRPGLDPQYIHVHKDGRLTFPNPSYYYRTVLSVDEMKNGNVSLKLSRVKLSDAAKYKCILQSLKKEASIELTVGAVSTPVTALADMDRNTGQVLSCESEGWYPQPEVSWLDAEGHVLPAGPTETVRGPDGLYTVSSRVTVDKRHSNTFTCRVQQKTISQTRETNVHVAADLFIVHSTSKCIWSLVILCGAKSKRYFKLVNSQQQ